MGERLNGQSKFEEKKCIIWNHKLHMSIMKVARELGGVDSSQILPLPC